MGWKIYDLKKNTRICSDKQESVHLDVCSVALCRTPFLAIIKQSRRDIFQIKGIIWEHHCLRVALPTFPRGRWVEPPILYGRVYKNWGGSCFKKSRVQVEKAPGDKRARSKGVEYGLSHVKGIEREGGTVRLNKRPRAPKRHWHRSLGPSPCLQPRRSPGWRRMVLRLRRERWHPSGWGGRPANGVGPDGRELWWKCVKRHTQI